MDIASIMASNLQQLQTTLSRNLLSGSLATQAAQSTVMLNDFTQNQQQLQQASHPTSGHHVDLKA
ncbi:polyribonucleotide nucleotidyltransferase [Alkalihalobacillus sp. AL-G]|uniref:polyribonucleotide nucleotidyltransferase n=1 Tax=Alkalihalobacillus sp. AL-G TaxID=2926399 RepID=UPI00272B3D58|nr:polyribonucleotide nucleotidyltransferase [Alkalihalobacillus sp. AL-G]WLD91573.1 polyribonucleotide nucleotidyltransferase [Alkalihalobacillus sp. AL-G]